LLYILWGEDRFSREEALNQIKAGLGDPSLLITNTTVLEGQKLTLNELRPAVETVPFLAPCRLVIIKGLLDRFEPDERAKPKKAASARKSERESDSGGKKEEELLAECINSLPQSTVLVLTDSIENKKKPLQNNPLYNAIASGAKVMTFAALKGAKLSQWIQERVNRYGGSISVQSTNLLMNYIGGDLYTLSNEIQKLVSYTGGRRIEEKDVREVVSASREAVIYDLIDYIIDRQAGPAEKCLQKLLQAGVVAPQILVLLARQVQMMVQIKELKALRKNTLEIQQRLGLFNSFALEKLSVRAQRYTLERLKEIYKSLLETDIAIKTGKYESDLAINILAVELCS
jgi:DNA polymerase-3 subunit delta